MSKKRTNWNELVKKKGQKLLKNPYKYLIYRDSEYSKEYLRQLIYRLKKKIGKNNV